MRGRTITLTWLVVSILTMQASTLIAADVQTVFGTVGEVRNMLLKIGEIKKAQEQERSGIAVANQIALALVPLPSANGPVTNVASVPNVSSAEVSPKSLRNTVAGQTHEQRTALADDINSQIQQLQAQLNKRLAISPRTPQIVKEIDAFNEALSAKRQAYDFARGTVDAISSAAAESFAATSNPYFLMCGTKYWAPNDPLRWYDQIIRVADSLATKGRSVGLLSVGNRLAGSGVVVGPHHIITNRHVLKELADYDNSTKIWTLRLNVTITFDKEYPLGASAGCTTPNPQRVYYINGVYFVAENGDDLAVLLASSDEKFPSKLDFVKRTTQDYAGNMIVAVIGYPGAPEDMTIAEQIQFFRTPTTKTPQFGYKRLSEGYTGAQSVTSHGVFVHKANTAGGNSGSPIFDLEDATLVGLHVQGHNRFQNELGYNEALTSERVLMLLLASGLIQE